ncbi:MAG: cellulose synthase/poly-beta-1,6-N-acetylglucosamine synthase-like glycosyltransferase [Phenylobacterium sp.]|jgi:cellulose synthase/poly-beta-1,6-N-acetylglucosamine synthase-like glycosyltransferase
MNVLLVFTLIIGFMIVYHHALYPLLLRWFASMQADTDVSLNENQQSDADLPTIELILPAYNEASVIAQKIRNIAELDYPANKLTVTLIGDGCSDNTMQIANELAQDANLAHLNLNICEFKQNRGKIAVINQAITNSQSEIVAMSDISALINRDGLKLAARRFQNAKVAVVNSSYHFANYSSPGEQAYWQYQSKIKQMESKTGSVIGAHGALYFFRRQLFTELRPDTINDDFVLPMSIVAKGYLAVHEAEIKAVELECVQPDSNNSRRKRIAAGNLQQAVRLRHLISPSFKGVAFNFLSCKVLRVFMPPCLILFYLASLVLASQYISFVLLAIGQSIFYALALYQHHLNATERSAKMLKKLIGVIYYFAAGHWYSFVGMTEYLLKKQRSW